MSCSWISCFWQYVQYFFVLHVKGSDSKITQETLFQTVNKETWCLVPEYHVFNNMYNISFYTCKGHWFQNHPRNVNGFKETSCLKTNCIICLVPEYHIV